MTLTKDNRVNLHIFRERHSNTATYTMSTRRILERFLSLFEISTHMSRCINVNDMTMWNTTTIILYRCRLVSFIKAKSYFIAGRFFLNHLIDGVLKDLSNTGLPSNIPCSTNIHTRKMTDCLRECLILSKLINVVCNIGIIIYFLSLFLGLFFCQSNSLSLPLVIECLEPLINIISNQE